MLGGSTKISILLRICLLIGCLGVLFFIYFRIRWDDGFGTFFIEDDRDFRVILSLQKNCYG